MRMTTPRAMAVFALAGVLSSSCTSSPAQPSTFTVEENAPAIAGTWTGLLEFLSCTGSNAYCDGSRMRDFVVTLAQSDDGLEGFLVFDAQSRVTIDLRAIRTAAGTFAFTAGVENVPGPYPVQTTVRDFTLATDAATGLTGAFEFTTTTASEDGDILSAVTRRVAIRSATPAAPLAVSPGNFHGRWEGTFATRSCTGDCVVGGGGYNYPKGGTARLELVQIGSAVSGSVNHVRVSGTATASSLTLTGPPLTSAPCQYCWDCDGICEQAVTRVTLTVDKLGRMRGTMEFALKGLIGLDTHFRQAMVADIVGVTRVR